MRPVVVSADYILHIQCQYETGWCAVLCYPSSAASQRQIRAATGPTAFERHCELLT